MKLRNLVFILMLSSFISIFAQSSDTVIVDINNIKLPMMNNGIIGVANHGAIYDDVHFLYSAGFFLSGKTNGQMWSNGVQESDKLSDYLPGNFQSDPNDLENKFYVVRSSDLPFGNEWQEWKKAVAHGARFYDGNGDSVYNPVDENNNGVWDANEDKPDLIGDITIWNIINDGKPKAERFFTNVEPQGIEIKQSVFAYYDQSNNVINNTIFVRYIIENVGENDLLDSVYFGTALDPDIGNYSTDLTGSDRKLQSAFQYKRIADSENWYGDTPPCFLVSMLQGASVFDLSSTATINKGPLLGIDTVKNSKLLGVNSSYSFNRNPSLEGPKTKEQMRNYLIGGLNPDGSPLIVKDFIWGNGDSLGLEADTTNPKFMFSGDPVQNNGWLNTTETDWRFLLSTGPFQLEKNKPIEMIFAYIIGRGGNPLNSVTVAKEYASEIERFYKSNFSELPVSVKSEQNIPNEFMLSQNYPNPFNPTTIIEYTIPTVVGTSRDLSLQEVTLKVYDILGREVATLVNEQKPAGNYEVNFNASSLSSGVYFYKIQSGSFTQVRKMLLLK